MKKLNFILFFIFTSCTYNYDKSDFDIICIDGVEYLIKGDEMSYHGFMTAHFRTDGSLYTCYVE